MPPTPQTPGVKIVRAMDYLLHIFAEFEMQQGQFRSNHFRSFPSRTPKLTSAASNSQGAEYHASECNAPFHPI